MKIRLANGETIETGDLTPGDVAPVAPEPAAPQLAPRQIASAPKLFDPKTGQELHLTDDQARQAVMSGAATVRKDMPVNLVGPDGKPAGSVVGSQALADAMSRGLRLENDKENRTGNFVQKNEGLSGALTVGAGKAVSEAAFGVPELIAQHIAPKEDVENWEALKEAHPVASGVGSAVGMGASMALGGGLFKGAEAAGRGAEALVTGGRAASDLGMGAKALGSAARLATEGAVISSPTVITEAALGDPREAAEHLMAGLGGGAVLGAVGSVAGGALKGLGKLAADAVEKAGVETTANPLKSLSEQQAFKSLMYGTDKKAFQIADQLQGGQKELGRYVLDNNLLRNPGERFEDYSARVGAHKDAIGNQIGGLYKELDAAGASGPTAEDIYKRFQSEVIDPLKRKATRGAEVQKLEAFGQDFLRSTAVQQGARDVANVETTPIALSDLWETQKDLGRRIYQEKKGAMFGNISPIDQELDKFRGILGDAIKAGAKPALQDAGRDAASELATLNSQYRKASMLDTIVDRSTSSESTRRNVSLSDYITGASSGGAMAAVHGGPIGLLTGAASSFAHKAIRENGNVLVAKYADQLGTYFAHQAAQQGEAQIAKIPAILSRLGNAGEAAAAVAPAAALNSLHMFLGKDAKKSDAENFDEVSKRLQAAATNPQQAQAHTAEMASTIAQGAPQIAQQFAQAQAQRTQYLVAALPKPGMLQPFSGKPSPPTHQAIASFKDKLEVALDPFAMLEHIRAGTLSPAHVDAAKSLYPAIHKRIANEIQMWSMSPAAAKTPQKSRVLLSLATGQPLDPGLRNVRVYQQNFADEARHNETSNPTGGGGASIKIPGATLTQQQRIRYG